MTAMYPGHGDVQLPIIAPGTVEECFFASIHALNWAERYQGPVVILSEHMLSERNQNIPKPDLSKVNVESRKTYQGTNGYHRYESWEISPMPIPGGPGSYVANGSEHDGMGDTTHRPERHIQMTTRRFSKLDLLKDGTYEREKYIGERRSNAVGRLQGARTGRVARTHRRGRGPGMVLHHVPQPASGRHGGRAAEQGPGNRSRA